LRLIKQENDCDSRSVSSPTKNSYASILVDITSMRPTVQALLWRLLTTIFLAVTAFAPPATSAQSKNDFTGDVMALVRRAAANEMQANQSRGTQNPSPVRFTIHKRDQKGATTKEIIQTREGSVARLIAVNDMPLSPEQEQAEHARLQRLLDQPEIQEHRRRREKEDADRANKLIKVMPDAFLYSYAGMAQAPSGPAIKLHFKPNPNFVPPDQESRVATGIEGELWIDQAQERMVRLDAHLFQDVDFGWGILGRLYKGGDIHIENADIGNHNWQLVNMKMDLVGKALMLKTLTFHITETASGFQPVPRELTYQDAVHLLQSNSYPLVPASGR